MSDRTTHVVGLIGSPVGHSISPAFQQAAFDHLGLAYRYEAWDTPAAELPAVINSLRSGERVGANVTIPHKEAVARLVDTLDGAAAALGAVNTITRDGAGRLTGHNTDVDGFSRALRDDGGFDVRGARVVVLGAGGAARAVVYALAHDGAAEVLIHNRTPERAVALVRALAPGDARLTVLSGDTRASRDQIQSCDLIVHCTSLGMKGGPNPEACYLPAELIPAGAFVCDIVANPAETPLMTLARARGCRTLGGLPMLARQGARAFELWTGRDAPLDVMFATAYRAMGYAPPDRSAIR